MDGTIAYLKGLGPVEQALAGTLFTWGVTALGACVVLIEPLLPGSGASRQKFLDLCYGFSGGVMLAASYFSLLAPAVDISEKIPMYSEYTLFERLDGSGGINLVWLPAAVGFLVGVLFVLAGDYFVKRHLDAQAIGAAKKNDDSSEALQLAEELRSRRTSWRRVLLLVAAITIHNIPEGMAVGVGFGALGGSSCDLLGCSFSDAFNLALGIGLQNFPEGMAVSLPLRRQGLPLSTCIFYGQLSGMVEPVAGVLGALLVTHLEPILPYAMSFAAGAMIFVVVDDLIPEAQQHNNGRLSSIGCVIGFIVMMSLDLALG
eukprot:TRINITY_DN27222_c0_g1_i1.p2 TRINITY_DN27222_c0_g1~~TRINITY_DN27222_c0_g1_i1.p2  ORF type:complete len:316 (+),score=131.75 TRINITY_DN27222_c0_g1_i1:102-1049(+)